MCTVSWLWQTDGGYQLLCNRDEKRSRLEAAPPRVERWGEVNVIAPRDGDAGGSWIAVNDSGVAVCLLNGSAPPVPLRLESRGLLLLSVATARGTAEVYERAWRADLTRIAPFTLLALQPHQPAAMMKWDGERKDLLPQADSLLPLVSSSVDAAGAAIHRGAEFARLTNSGRCLTTAALRAFHGSHIGGASAYSPCMHRVDAATVSFSWITVAHHWVDFFYAPGAPCEFRPGHSTRLARRHS